MKRIFLPILFAFILLLLASIVYINVNSQPVASTSTPQNFVVNEGDGVIDIAQRLEKNKLIKNQYVFILKAYMMGLNSRLQSGGFRLSSSMPLEDLITKLSKGGTKDYWLKIIDGSRVEEIANKYENNNALTPKDFLHAAKPKEGSLFPDNYLLPEYYSADEVLNTIEENFNKKLLQAKANTTNTSLSDGQILILASLLEREAKTVESKQMVAGILLNRLKINMALQIDATVQYARDSRLPAPSDYWQPILANDIDKIVSPFNTYKNPGLPPAPICNPGYNSLYAAYHPKSSDYLFYITGNDHQMHYAKTLEEHNQNIKKYL